MDIVTQLNFQLFDSVCPLYITSILMSLSGPTGGVVSTRLSWFWFFVNVVQLVAQFTLLCIQIWVIGPPEITYITSYVSGTFGVLSMLMIAYLIRRIIVATKLLSGETRQFVWKLAILGFWFFWWTVFTGLNCYIWGRDYTQTFNTDTGYLVLFVWGGMAITMFSTQYTIVFVVQNQAADNVIMDRIFGPIGTMSTKGSRGHSHG